MHDLTALILTYNERENIARTLSALSAIPRVLIIDSFSTDQTLEIVKASRPDAVVVQRGFDSFAGQCNFGLAQVSTAWVLSIDADYVLTPELAKEIMELEPAAEIRGYSAKFRYCVFGRPLRTTIYPPRTVLYRRESANYENEGHGHRVRISGAVGSLQGQICHDDRKPLSRWLESQDGYFKIEARHLRATPNDQLNRQDRLRKKIFFAPWVIFLYLLFGRGLVLDGWPGWYYVCQRTVAEALLSLRLLTERERLEEASASTPERE
jgi:glycosyltransferase involved in cell wall biosynthesis